jgi:hypothetical protein
MRALCGAIITAGALLGVGLAAIGFGIRYQLIQTQANAAVPIKLGTMDTALVLAFVVTVSAALVGLATTFVGLAYHHERRSREYEHQRELLKAGLVGR